MSFFKASRTCSLAFLAICSAVIASTAIAGPLATTNLALNDGFGPDAGRWHGSVNILATALGNTVNAEVDWAAFAPGPKFQQYLDSQSIAQVNPAASGEVIYVYQVVSVSAAAPGIGTLTVGVDPTDARGSISAPFFLPIGAGTEKSPSSGGDNTTSMAWFFSGNSALQAGNTTGLLVFTSPFAPELDFLALSSGLAGGFAQVASISDRIFQFDVPEPSTVLLALFGCVGFMSSRKSSR